MAKQSITLKVRVAFWVKPYIKALSFACFLMQREPDTDKLQRLVNKGISLRVD